MAGPGTDTLAGRRLVFLTGSREASGKNSETAGMYDLTEDGAKMFLNAVDYMLDPQPAAVPVVQRQLRDARHREDQGLER